jgi:hypothetical protein
MDTSLTEEGVLVSWMDTPLAEAKGVLVGRMDKSLAEEKVLVGWMDTLLAEAKEFWLAGWTHLWQRLQEFWLAEWTHLWQKLKRLWLVGCSTNLWQ